MFEKEAEEYADWFWGASPSAQRAIKQAYQQGAEYVYNNCNKQLTKAKEIIREYMRFEPMIGTCSFYLEEYEKTKKKAEQFLKENT